MSDKRKIETSNHLGELIMASPCKTSASDNAWVELRVRENIYGLGVEYKIHTCYVDYNDNIGRIRSMYTTDQSKAMDYFFQSYKEM